MSATRLLLVAALLVSSTALADKNGIFAVGPLGCNGCHFGGAQPTISLDLSKTEVVAGETISATVKISNSNAGAGGFLLRATSGAMKNPGAGVKVAGSGATHSSPKVADANNAFVFTVDWTAPSVSGPVTFNAYGNASNANNQENGDRGVNTSATVNVCATRYYPDEDGDGYGTGGGTVACTQPAGTSVDPGDCNDTNAGINPNVFETCGNGIDDDCNGAIDDGAACAGGTPDAGTSGTPDAGSTVDGGTGPTAEPGGCGCSSTPGSVAALVALAAFGSFSSRRRRRA